LVTAGSVEGAGGGGPLPGPLFLKGVGMIARYQQGGKIGDALSAGAELLLALLRRRAWSLGELRSIGLRSEDLATIDSELRGRGLALILTIRLPGKQGDGTP
jgi:hypothetical protein